MKRIVITMLMAAFLAAPAAISYAAETTPSTSQESKKGEVKTVVFSTNMHCKNCVKKVNENLSVAKGVKSLDVNLEKQKITIGYDSSKTNEETLAAAIVKLGYKAEKQSK